MHNQNIKFKQAREEKLTSKYKQSRIQHQEELKRKSAILGRAFVDFQKKVAKMDLKDMESNSEIAVLRWVSGLLPVKTRIWLGSLMGFSISSSSYSYAKAMQLGDKRQKGPFLLDW